MNQEFPQYLIDTWKKKKLIVVFIILISVVVLSAIIGAIGPEELYNRKLDFGISPTKTRYSQNVTIKSLTKNHQLLVVQSKFRNRQEYGLMVELPFETRVFGNNISPYNRSSKFEEIVSTVHKRVVKCEPKKTCTSHTIAYMPYLKYRNYRVESIHEFNELGYLFDHIYFDFYYVNKAMVSFEIVFRYIFVMTVLAVMFILVRVTRGIAFKNYTITQKWITYLLVLLLLKNNPIFSAQLIDHSLFVRVLDFFFTAAFRIALLAFFLIITDSYRYSKEERNTRRYYLPRIIPLLLISLFILIIYFNLITNELNDPQIEEERDIAGFRSMHTFIFYLFITYICWIFISTIQTFVAVFKKNGQLNNLTEENVSYKKRFLFFFTLELILLIFGNIEFFGNFLPKVRTSSYEFIMMFSVDTIIIIFYGFSFLPSDTENIFRNIKKRKNQTKKDQIISDAYNPDVSQNEKLNIDSDIDEGIDTDLNDHHNILESDLEEDLNEKSELQKNNDSDSSIINSQSDLSDKKNNSDKKQIITYQDSHLDDSQNENLINSGSENN
ncbi:transmembrane protein [Anaeramoeba flamelloides]|uniref:Transmembrane protein n=1 Tax=Anaeramoeba flamelloides TaxID=1746091 RepID=A0AAV7ZW61_9EUKA|nr:transmembrane protein [Anaeramoeba flamelloides]